jgi:lipopolysaccharide heptosyltransferase II
MTFSDLKLWKNAKNLLCVRLDAMGDVLMSTPAFRALKESIPSSRITLLTSASGAEIARLIPEVDDILVYDAPWLKATQPRTNSQLDHQWITNLREMQFDGAVIFTVYSQNPLPSALMCFLADIPLRAAHCRENPYQLLTHWIPDREPQDLLRHEVRRQLDLVKALDCVPSHEKLSLQCTHPAQERIEKLLEVLEIEPSTKWVMIHPGASASSRRYPPALFAKVAAQLIKESHMRVIFTGSESERPIIEEIQKQLWVHSDELSGLLNVDELAALIKKAPVVIANNTGTAHMAAALGTPVVDLYALTNPQHTPWQVPQRVLYQDVPCRYCFKSICPAGHHRCMSGIPPEKVFHACLELLDEAQQKTKSVLEPSYSLPPLFPGGPSCTL